MTNLVIFSHFLHSVRSSEFAGRVGAMSLSRAMMSLSALVVLIVLPRLIGQGEIAHFRKLWLLYGIAGPVMISAVVSTAYFRAGDGHVRSALRELLILAGIGGLIVGGLNWILSPFMADHFMVPQLTREYRLFSFYCVLLIWVAVAEPLFVSTHHKRSLPFYTAFFSMLDVLAVILPFAKGWGIPSAVLGMILAQAARLPVIAMLYTFWTPKLQLTEKGFWPSSTSINYAVGMALLALSGVGAVEVDRIVVGSFLDDVSFALYDYGSRKIPFITILTASVTSAIVAGYSAEIRSGELRGALVKIKSSTNHLFRLLGPPLMVTAAGAPALMAFVFGEPFRAAGTVFALFMVALFSNLVFPHAFVLASGRSNVNVMGALAELFVNVVLSLALLPYLGIVGVALGSAIAHWVYASAMMEYCRRKFSLPWTNFLPSSLPWWALLSTMGLSVGAWLTRNEHVFWFGGFVIASLGVSYFAVKNFRKNRSVA